MPQLHNSSSRPSLRTPTTPSKSRIGIATTPVRASTPTKTPVKTRAAPPKSPAKPSPARAKGSPIEAEKSAPALSLREAIALKRAEAKKLQPKASTSSFGLGGPEDIPQSISGTSSQDEDGLGRLTLRQAIERARSTGSINLATRSLPCIPSALFEIHLGVTPEPLKSVPNEPPLPPSTAELQAGSKRANNPAWYETQDLLVIKAWNNEIVEIQPEISMFGSLKTVDLHQNKIASLPDAIGDLMSLTSLDVSHNQLTSLPDNLFSLPELISLNVSHNKLTSLPFNAAFTNGAGVRRVSTNFFSITIDRASSPLPRLLSLDASYNDILASAIHPRIPVSLSKLDLSSNPLDGDGNSTACLNLIQTLGGLPKLAELRLEKAGIGDSAFPPSLADITSFPSLRVFDLSETKVTADAAVAALKGMKHTLESHCTADEPPAGVCRVIVGKKMMKEAWEIEAENQAKRRPNRARDTDSVQDIFGPEPSKPPSKPTPTAPTLRHPVVKNEVVKEAWEVEAEQGLLTEGAKRRARTMAAAEQKNLGHGKAPSTDSTSTVSSLASSPSQSTLALSNPKYYTEATLTLKLPPCIPSTKSAGHNRTFSLATPGRAPAATASTDIVVPTPTLPLSLIVTQPFSNSLKCLILVNRRMDCCFSLPSVQVEENLLPNLEELNLENCNLPDLISVTRGGLATRTSEPIIPLITKLFHNLQTLSLSYNGLCGSLQDSEALTGLILAKNGRRGLRHLRLRGNGIKDVEGLQRVATMFKGFREVPEWKLDELDIRDNNIERLPPELGLLPLDVFLVDGNMFRVPQRRVWEREGTKGLLSWLRGRIE